MGIRNLAVAVYCAIVGFAILCATQQLSALLAEQWGRPIGATALA
jgi:hypothetical protein